MRRSGDTLSIHQELVQNDLCAPVELGGIEERLWLDCDLASMAESRIGDTTDPRELEDARRADWLARVTNEEPTSLLSRSRYERCYWLLDGTARIGTVALTTSSLGNGSLHLSSFYIFPALRRRGAGARFFDRLKEILARHDTALRLDTSWCWPRAVRFYLREGMWLYMWKRELTFFWDKDLPRADVQISDEEASLAVPVDGERLVLASARRHGSSLEFAYPTPERRSDARVKEVVYLASSTLALHLALSGWPLIQSKQTWDEDRYADGGPPEALAYKISIWEAWDKKQGWQVPTVRIPGLEYLTWDELEVRWAEENKKFEATLAKAP